jgi:hypothetical protein
MIVSSHDCIRDLTGAGAAKVGAWFVSSPPEKMAEVVQEFAAMGRARPGSGAWSHLYQAPLDIFCMVDHE